MKFIFAYMVTPGIIYCKCFTHPLLRDITLRPQVKKTIRSGLNRIYQGLGYFKRSMLFGKGRV